MLDYYDKYINEYNNNKTNLKFKEWLKSNNFIYINEQTKQIKKDKEPETKKELVNEIINSKNKDEYINKLKNFFKFYQEKHNQEDISILES